MASGAHVTNAQPAVHSELALTTCRRGVATTGVFRPIPATTSPSSDAPLVSTDPWARSGLLRQHHRESFFATLECELLDPTLFENRNAARVAVFDFIETLLQPLAPPILP